MRKKHTNVMRGYDWSEVITLYMGSKEVPPMDEVVLMTVKVDKQYGPIAAQMIAVGWGLA